VDFTIGFYSSITGGSQPDAAHAALVQYHTNGNAQETPADSLSGTRFYTYAFALPAPFTAAAQTKYWIQIEAFQHGVPDWGIAAAADQNGTYYRRISNVGDIMYQSVPGNVVFSLSGQAPAASGAKTTGAGTSNTSAQRVISRLLYIGNTSTVFQQGTVSSMHDLLGRSVWGPNAIFSRQGVYGRRLGHGTFVALLRFHE
jgi:hypothetical protein